MPNIFYERRHKIEDDVNGLVHAQRRCYLTLASARNCHAHEWLIKRSCGLPKVKQGKIFAICNMVLVEANLHLSGLNAFEDLYICKRKLEWHGRTVIDEFLTGLEMRTIQTLDQWISSHCDAANRLIDRGFYDDSLCIKRSQSRSLLFLRWIDHWNSKLDGEPLTADSFFRSVGI